MEGGGEHRDLRNIRQRRLRRCERLQAGWVVQGRQLREVDLGATQAVNEDERLARPAQEVARQGLPDLRNVRGETRKKHCLRHAGHRILRPWTGKERGAFEPRA